MREMDLQVQNTMDTLQKRTDVLFSNAKKMNQTERDNEYEEIRSNYYKTLGESDVKVQLANQMHEQVTRYLRRLEQDTMKFKLELEADNMGITEVLEKRAEEPDLPPNNGCQKENRYSHQISNNEMKKDSGLLRMMSALEEVQNATAPISANNYGPSHLSGGTLGHMKSGGTAIAAAASQAIVATQQMQQGRRTESLKASYNAINTGPQLSICKELAGAANTAIRKKNKKKKKTQSRMVSGATPAVTVAEPQVDAAADPNEPRYCICNEVAYGDMVGCDHPGCPYEWYHNPCVGVVDPPKGKWFCPLCTDAMKRRGSSKN